MRTAHGDGDAHFADLQMTQAMNDHHLAARPTLAGLAFDFRHFLLSHGGIRFIIQRGRCPAIGQVANRSQKSDNPAAIRPADLLRERMIINRIVG